MEVGQTLNLNNVIDNSYATGFFGKVGGLFNDTIGSVNFVLFGNILEVILTIYSLYFVFIITYSLVRMTEVREQEKEQLKHEIKKYALKRAGDLISNEIPQKSVNLEPVK